MFSQASVCPGGVCTIACWDTHTHPGQTPFWQVHPVGRHTPPRQVHPPAQCMLGYTSPLRSACWDTVNKRAVRIPLECILVLFAIAVAQCQRGFRRAVCSRSGFPNDEVFIELFNPIPGDQCRNTKRDDVPQKIRLSCNLVHKGGSVVSYNQIPYGHWKIKLSFAKAQVFRS